MVPDKPIKLYRHPLSGHSHRVELFLSLLGLPFELHDVDLRKGAHKKPEFLAMNAFGQVPVIDDSGTLVADSNAILVYLALKYGDERWLPRDPLGAAAVQRWLSVAAGQLGQGPALARSINVFGLAQSTAEPAARARALFAVLEAELARRPFLVSQAPTLADLACYAYVACAPEGDVSLADFPSIRAWLGRIEALPRFVPMQRSAVGLAAS